MFGGSYFGGGTPITLLQQSPPASLLLQSVFAPGEKTSEGQLIEAVTLPWFEIIAAIGNDPKIVFQISPRKWGEIIATAYKKAQFDEVILTPRSGDLGRDVIATKKGLGTVRVIDQVKAYGPGHLVTADDVRALLGVLWSDGASKDLFVEGKDEKDEPQYSENRLEHDAVLCLHRCRKSIASFALRILANVQTLRADLT